MKNQLIEEMDLLLKEELQLKSTLENTVDDKEISFLNGKLCFIKGQLKGINMCYTMLTNKSYLSRIYLY